MGLKKKEVLALVIVILLLIIIIYSIYSVNFGRLFRAPLSTLNFVPPTPNNGDIINNPNVEIRMQLTPLIALNDMTLNFNSVDYKLPTLISCSFENTYVCDDGEIPGDSSFTTFTTGKFGNGVLVDNKDEDGDTIADPDFLYYPSINNINLNEGTIMFWVIPQVNWGVGDTRSRRLIDTTTLGPNGISILKSPGTATTSGSITASIATGSPLSTGVSTSAASFIAQDAHSIAVTYGPDGLGNNVIELYIDGVLVAGPTIYTGSIQAFNQDIYIGLNNGGTAQANGVFDQFTIYAKKLSSTEINNLHNKEFGSYYIKFNNLAIGSYTFSASAVDTANQVISSETRSFTISSPPTTTIDFLPPTPADNANVPNPPADVTIKMQRNPLIPGENLIDFTLSFNSVNYKLPNLLSCDFKYGSTCDDGEDPSNSLGISAPFGYFDDAIFVDNDNGFGGGDIFTYSSTNNFNLNEGTIMFWVKPMENWIGDSRTRVLLDTTTFMNGISIQKTPNDFLAITLIANSLTAVGVQADLNTLPIPFDPGTWHHIAVTYGNNNLGLYIDGIPVSLTTYLGTMTAINPNIYIGHDNSVSIDCPECTGGRHAVAVFDEFKIYGKSLTTQQINDIYNGYVKGYKIGSYFVNFTNLPQGAYTYSASITEPLQSITSPTRSFTRPVCSTTCEYTLMLNPGVNLVSLPLPQTSNLISALPPIILNNLRSIYSYETASGLWKVYHTDPGRQSTLSTIDPKTSYFFVMKNRVLTTITGDVTNPTRTLNLGWNMIAIEGLEPRTIAQLYNMDPLTITEIWKLNAQGIYEQVVMTSLLEPGVGYWVFAQ
ncbi:LamG domain-containing protein [Candidatus Woesearchaeota archaeon]|nr:LamG domain-containing protein [Candidatus Woesearchaeota archaeon]